jgi:radical SAM protein with 4Fe4S-binding SPASM domain
LSLAEVRKRLPIVASLPKPGSRFDSLVDRMSASRPKWAIWELTLACDQKCSHCGPRAGKKRPHELSTEECLAVIAELAHIGCGEVVLIGGEAYLRNDFILIIRAIREAGMSCTLTTGGLNMSEERVEAMVEAGVSSVSVSIDGLEEAHDRVRGVPGSWQRAFEAMRRIKKAGAQVACNTQINQMSRNELLPLLELLAPEGIHSWQLQITAAHGNAADHPEIILQPYMMLELFETLDVVVKRCAELKVRVWPANSLGYFGPLERKLRAAVGTYWRGCPAGVNTVGIDSDGGIKNCPSLGGPLNVGGNWREQGIKEIWDDSYQLGYIRKRTVDDLWGYCRDCYYNTTCMAGCTAISEPLLGRPGNNPFCHHRAVMLDREGHRERIEHVMAAPGESFDNGLFRVIREHKDPELRAQHGPVQVDEPRVSRAVEPFGPGRPVEGLPPLGGLSG